MDMKKIIISLYPLTTTDIDKISQVVGGDVGQIILSNITAKGYFDVFCLLRSIKAESLYFPIISESNQGLTSLYKVLGMISRAQNIFIVMPDFSLIPLARMAGLFWGVEIIFGIFSSIILLLRDYLGILNLLRSPRIVASRRPSERILFLKHTLWLGLQAGGSIAHSMGVIKGLLKGGQEVDLLSLDSRLPITAQDSLRTIKPNSVPPYIIPRELNFSQFNKTALEALISNSSRPYRAIYQRLSPGNFTGVLLSRLKKVPLVIEYNGSELWLSKNWGSTGGLSRFVEKAELVCLKHAHLVVTVSDVLKDELIASGIEPDRIITYPNGVDPEEFNPERFSDTETRKVRKELGVPEDAVLLTFVGTFGHWHGADLLAETLTDKATSTPEWFEEHNIFVCFVGDGVKRHAVNEMIAKCPLSDRFKLTGMVPQEMTPHYMAASDILLSPHVPNPDGSPFFGSPTKLFEYMASGRPIIASDLFQIGEVLDGAPHTENLPSSGSMPSQKECGILVKPKSGEDIIQAIEFLVKNPEWRRAAGQNARARALARYTWVHHTEEIISGLDKVLLLHEPPARKPIKVLLNALHAKTGGGVTYLRNILPLITMNPDFEFHLCLHEDQIDILPELNGRVEVHAYDFKSGFWRLPFWEQIEIPKLARKIGADVTFSPANYGPFFARNHVIMLRNALGVAFVERRPVKIAYWLLVSIGTFISMITSRRVIAVSKYARHSNFGSITGVLRRRVSVVPHGVSKAFSVNAINMKRENFILAVSDIYVQKNLKNLLNAVAMLRSQRPNIKLKIAGRFVDESYHQELKNIIIEKDLKENIEFLGGVHESDLVELYRQCAVFVFPSTVETFGNPLIEAMASGAPIATSNTAAMPEVAGDAAIYFDPHNVDEMASSIGQLLADKELCNRLSEKAVARSQNYSWEKTAESTLDILYQAAPEVTE